MISAMSSEQTVTNARSTSRGLDVAMHASSLVLAVIVSIVVGKPLGWIAFLFPLGPLLVAGVARVLGAGVPRGLRSLVAFDIVAGVLVGGGWLAMFGAKNFSLLVYVFPISLLAFGIGLLNYVMVTISRTIRAVKAQTFDYPWIPDRLARVVGLPPRWME